MNLDALLDPLEKVVRDADPTDLPDLLAGMARVDALARLRLADLSDDRPHERRKMDKLDRYLRAEEVAERLGCSKKWVYDHQHEIGAVKLGARSVRFPEKAIKYYLKSIRHTG